MTKKEQLEKIDNLLLDKIIDCLENDKTDLLPELNVVVQVLAKNNVTSEKTKSTTEEDIAKRVKEAEERRKKKNV